jgi:tRNA threonylcarbamoyladenosine biosynthesis protein TsaB
MSGTWLALDTATDRASVAVGAPPATAATAAITGARRHAAEIIGLIDDTLRRAAVLRDRLAGIVVCDGPGSFTGLRIGWAAAKSLAHERDVAIVAIPALLAVARGAATRVGDGLIAACFDALRGQVFAAVYRIGERTIDTVLAPVLLTPAELMRQAGERPRVVAGDGAVRYADSMRAWSGAAPLTGDDLPPNAESLLALVGRDGVGRRVSAADEPVYGRPAEAQAKWEARHGRALPDPTGNPG